MYLPAQTALQVYPSRNSASARRLRAAPHLILATLRRCSGREALAARGGIRLRERRETARQHSQRSSFAAGLGQGRDLLPREVSGRQLANDKDHLRSTVQENVSLDGEEVYETVACTPATVPLLHTGT